MNRSIQAEGSFGELKQDMSFRRYLSRGTQNVTAESILLAMAYNISKLHNKIQKKECHNNDLSNRYCDSPITKKEFCFYMCILKLRTVNVRIYKYCYDDVF